MDILKISLFLLLISDLDNALQTKRQNQTISTVITKIGNFIEDDIEPQLNLNNKNLDGAPKLVHPPKENSTVKKLDLKKGTKVSLTPKQTEEKKAVNAIHLPLDLLLSHPKIKSPKNSNLGGKSLKNVTRRNNCTVNYLKPKIKFCEDTMEAVDESIADFYRVIKANNKTNGTSENVHDIKVVDEFVNINISDPDNLEVTQIEARNASPDSNNYFRITSSPNVKPQRNFIDTPNAKIEILIKNDPPISNDILRLNSSIVIHNTTYQEITKPTFYPTSPRCTLQQPFRWYGGYPCFYKFPYTRCNDYCTFCYNNQYTRPYTAPNTVWKAWSNIDLSVSNPNDIKLNCADIGDTPEYVNLYDIHDQNVV